MVLSQNPPKKTGWLTTAEIVAWGSIVIGGWLTLDTTNIRTAIGNFVFGPRNGAIAWSVVRFCAVTLAWAAVLNRRLRLEDKREQDRREDLFETITTAPNSQVFTDYPKGYLRPCFQALKAAYLIPDSETPEARLQAFEVSIQIVLQAVARMAAYFARAEPSDLGSYGANIMLAAAPDPSLPNRFPQTLIDRLRFHEKENVAGLRAILYLPPELLLQKLDTGVSKEVPILCLPVPLNPEPRGFKMVLPGAPLAFWDGRPSIYGDTRVLGRDYCTGFAKPIVEEVEEYFSPRGEGKAIRSFASFRIGSSREKPIGVLNIDASRTDLLGPTLVHPTFLALLAPILLLMQEPVTDYARLRAQQGTLYGESAPPTQG